MQYNTKSQPLRIGILGFGHLGQFIYTHFEAECKKSAHDFELVFIWNRSKDVFSNYDKELKQELIVGTSRRRFTTFTRFSYRSRTSRYY